jgi:ZIP family zinc transporter
MLSALFFSLLIPSIELSTFLGNLRFIPSCVGVSIGILMFVLIDKIIHKYQKKQFLMPLVVTLHNIPEGMAVGVAIASLLQENILMTYASVFALSIGIAIQNIPEGAIISMALKSKGVSKFKSFLIGVASGAVEPIATFITILFTNMISTIQTSMILYGGAQKYWI